MQLISKYKSNKIFIYALLIFIVNMHGCSFKRKKKGIKITSAFKNILVKSNRKPNKIWVNKHSEFYNTAINSWLQDNDIEMYSTHNEGKSVVADTFIRTLKKNDKHQYQKTCILIN